MVTEAPPSHRDDKKLEIVERILRGQLTLQEACVKCGVSGPELKEWVRLYRREARRVLDDRVRAALTTQGMDLEELESAEFSGSVETLSVAEVIQTLALGRKDAEISVEHDGQLSRIWCADGELVDAECGRLLGAPAVYRLLTLQRGRVHAECGAPVRRPRTINVSAQALLMEAARRSDECRELVARLGDMNHVCVPSSAAQAPGVDASPTELAVLRLFDGQRTLAHVVEDSTLPDLETLVHLVQLRERGMLDPSVRAPSSKPSGRPSSSARRASGRPSSPGRASGRPSGRPSSAQLSSGQPSGRPSGRPSRGGLRATGPQSRPSGRASAPGSVRGGNQPSELSFVPLAASLGLRNEPRWPRRWVWGLVVVGTSTLGAALLLRYSEWQAEQRAAAERGSVRGAAKRPRTQASGGSSAAPGLPTGAAAAAAVVPARAVPGSSAAAGALPLAGACPEGAALLSRPATRDTEAQAYCLDRREVTVAAYARCTEESRCSEPRREPALPEAALTSGARRRAQAAFAGQCNTGVAGRGQHPLNCVTYTEAETYCVWRGGRLPSEAEWDFAAEGVNGRTFPWGTDEPSPLLVNACGSECRSWYVSLGLVNVFDGMMYEGSDGYAGTAPVGSFPAGATPEGILDLIGNVAEWTSGSVEVYDGDTGADAVASHVVRGGAFTSSQAALNPPVLRLYLGAEERDRSVGFRCAFALK